MTILRWLLSHLVLLIVVATLVFAWLRWDDLQGWVPEPVNRVVMQLREELGGGGHESGTPAVAEKEESGPVSERLPAMAGAVVVTPAPESASGAMAEETTVAAGSARDKRFPPTTESAGAAEAPAAVAENGAGEAPTQEPGVVASADTAGVEQSVSSAAEATAEDVQAAAGHAATEKAGQEAEAGAVSHAAAPVVASAESRDSSVPPAEVPVSLQQDVAPSEAPATEAKSSDGARFEALLARAREAFWRRDLQASVAAYRELTRMAPENPDVWGELGNVLFAANEMPQAAEAYAHAAELLLATGRPEDVPPLLPIIQRFSPEKARALQQKLHTPMPRG
ncbi:MAG: hypothetical protein D6717_04005 [Gammaproteobacteria bacterium]|nr:MAG: hypothetical protein D6717_04005 [Gammaproteobacteria bacterium]